MLEKIQPKTGKIGSLPTLFRFIRELPFETVCVAIAAFLLVLASHNGGSFPRSFPSLRCLLSVVFIAPLGFSTTLLKRGGRISAKVAAVAYGVLCVAAFAFAYFLDDVPPLAIGWRLAPAFLFSAASPFIASAFAVPKRTRNEAEAAFSGFVRSFVESATTGLVYFGAAAIAILVIFAGITTLFDFFPDELLADALTLLTAISVLFFFESLLRPPTKDVSRLWQVVTKKIAAPFVAAMVSIVGIYEIWVLLTGQMPKNTLSPLLIGTGVIGIIAALVIQAMLDGETAPPESSKGMLQRSARIAWERQLSIVVVKWFHVTMFLLLPMGMWAVFARVDQYGFTPFRVARLAVLLALFFISIAGILRLLLKKGPVSFDAAAIFLVIAGLITIGPLSAVDLSIDSQTTRLQNQFSSLGITGDIPAETEVFVSRGLQHELQTTVDVIRDLGGFEALSDAGIGGAVNECRQFWSCSEALGVFNDESPSIEQGMDFEHLATDAPLDLPKGRYLDLSVDQHTDIIYMHGCDYLLIRKQTVFELWENDEKISQIDVTADAGLEDWQSSEPRLLNKMGKTLLFPSTKPGKLGGIILQEAQFGLKDGHISHVWTAEGLWLLPSSTESNQ